MKPEPMTPQDWLLAEYEQRRAKNPRYSLRALAQLLQLPPGRLSEILSGKRQVTPQTAEKISEALAYSPKRRDQFHRLVSLARKSQAVNQAVATSATTTPSYKQLSLDQYHVVADWYHFAILSLMELRDFESNPDCIARRLGISKIQAAAAVKRLMRVGLIEAQDGKWISTGKNIETPTDLRSSALRRSHRQTLQQAIAALEGVSIEERDITSMTMAIDSRKLPEAKKLIRDFRKKLAAFLEEGEADQVYNLNIQLMPVTKKSK
jgi:uncharacterized protein (TIGR02147 family)